MEHYISDEKLFDTLFIKPSPHHIEMSRWKPRWCVRRWWCTTGRALMKPVIKGTPMPTRTPTPRPWSWLIPGGSSWRGSPNSYSDDTSTFTSSKKSVRVNWVDFSISLCVSYIKMFDVMGKPSTTSLPHLTFSYFLLLLLQQSTVYLKTRRRKKNHRKTHTCSCTP